MEEYLNEDLLSFLKEEYKIKKSSPCHHNKYIIRLENMLTSDNEVLEVLDVRKVEKEKIDKYLKCLEEVSKIENEYSYLVKYSMIKEEKGYIFLKMPEYIGNLNEDISIYPVYENLMKKGDSEEKDEDEKEEEEEEEEHYNYKKVKSIKSGIKESNEKPKIIEYRGEEGSLRYNAYYDVCYSVYLLHSNGLIHGHICDENVLYLNKHFYLSDYCQYILFGENEEYGKNYNSNIESDIYNLGRMQEKLSSIAVNDYITAWGSNTRDEDKVEDHYDGEEGFEDQMIKKLWRKTQKGEYDIVKILEELDSLEVKEWDKKYETDPETYSCTFDDLESARCERDELNNTVKKLKGKIFALNKEREKDKEKIKELENTIENLMKENGEKSVKRKKLTN